MYNEKAGIFENYKFKTPKQNQIISLKKLNESQLIFGTREAGAYIFNTQQLTKPSYSIIEGTENNQVWSVAIDENKNYWVTTDKAGIICSNKDFKLDVSVGLQSNVTYKVFIDREKNIWIGTGNAGMAQYLGNRFTHITNSELPDLTQVSAIVRDKTNIYWLGTSMGIYKISYNKNQIKLLKQFTTNDGLPSNEVISMSIGKDNTLWIATKNGISNFNGNNFKNYSESDGLISNNTNYIFADSKNRIWIGADGGLSLFNEERNFINMSESNGLINNEVQCVYEARNGFIWIGTYGGLIKFDGTKLQSFDEADGLTEKKINTLTEDKNGNIYIGTFGGGIFKYNANSKKTITSLCAESKFISNNINSLVFQNDSVLIASTNLGLNKINFTKDFKIKSINYYGKPDGFKNLENSLNAVHRDNNNGFWFGTTKGVTLYHPAYDKQNTIKPLLRITDLKVNGISFFFNGDLNFNHNQNSIKVSFVAISLTNPSGNSYFSKLLGLDTTWNNVLIDEKNIKDFAFVDYKKLQPGNYELVLMCKNNDGIESNITSLKFNIALPFYKTAWFIISSLIAFAFIVYGFFKYKERNLILEKEKLETIVTERTAEVVASKKEIEGQRNLLEIQKHEITDSINYSKRIQNAILPEQRLLFDNLPDSFLLYQPKDIVSGDFYYLSEEREGKFYLGIADCTGHGVPGAFMSMVGSKELNDAVTLYENPKDILCALNVGLRKTLKQSNLEIGIKDGMDIAFLLFHNKAGEEKTKLSYSGANRPLWILKNGQNTLFEIKATKTAIGGYTLDDQVFEQHEVILEKGDAIYLFSDGYADQFGGDFGKKMMTKRFKEIVIENGHLPMAEQGKLLSSYFQKWKGTEQEQVDDVLVVGVRV